MSPDGRHAVTLDQMLTIMPNHQLDLYGGGLVSIRFGRESLCFGEFSQTRLGDLCLLSDIDVGENPTSCLRLCVFVRQPIAVC